MNIKQINYFLRVVECKSIAAAARELNIAQPALSLQISKLEHELKTTLFSRSARGVQLTEAGSILTQHARLILNQLDKATTDISELEGTPKGTIVVAMNQATDNILALPLCKAVEEKYPQVDLDLRTGLSYEVIDLLKKGEADLAIIYEDGLETSHIHRELLIKENLLFTTKPDTWNTGRTEIPFSELIDFELAITSDKESLGYIVREYEEKTGITLKKRRPYGQLLTSLRFACEGRCHLLLPSSAFFHLEEQQMIKGLKVTEPEVFRNVYIATESSRPVRNITLKAIDLIKRLTQEVHQQGIWQGKLP